MGIWELGQFPVPRRRIFITKLVCNSLRQVYSKPDYLDIYFAKVGCRISATGEYYHLIFPQKLSSCDYSSFYASGDNCFGLIQPTPYSAGKLESKIPDEYVVDNMVDYMMESMERKNCQIHYDSDYSCG